MREQKIVHRDMSTPFRRVMSASTLSKDSLRNRMDQDVGSIKEIMIDVPSGRVAYAVLAVGGFLGIGERLFAIPWESLTLDEDRKCFVIDVDKQRLQNAPGFNKNNWPDMADPTWASGVSSYWNSGISPADVPVEPHKDEIALEASGRYNRDASSMMSNREIDGKSGETRSTNDSREASNPGQAEQTGKSRAK